MSFTSTETERVFFINSQIVVVSKVKADDSLYRVIVDSVFRGYLKKIDNEFTRTEGSTISDAKFEVLCNILK